ncbi:MULTISPECIES: RNA polymerase factor sigma-54 [unclassified Lebetimonas]|uniref:RNA polymerase factor sigma-54 n=1 Tax=unclassified Lebetimonas TaxID=2648158 RepID=UPI000465F1D3|nr:MULTISPECIES: RNA polymerase factor sigma-54 [unclassified Lebetimonas]
MELKQSLSQKQVPRLSMKMWLPILECSVTELDEHLRTISYENPCIEISNKTSPKAYSEYVNRVSNASTDSIEALSINEKNLYEILEEQIIPPLFPTKKSQKVAKEIILNINKEGYFEGNIEEIANICNVTPTFVESVRQRFEYLEPSGIGAENFKEAFLFQLVEYDLDDELSLLLSNIIKNFSSMDKFINHPRFKDAKDILKRLKYPPAVEFKKNKEHIVPDMHIFFEKGELVIMMNSQFYPDVKINFVNDSNNYLKKKFKEAKELVNMLDLRKKTLYNIALIITEKQYSFFVGGSLKPLRLKDVAKELGFNESTISRAIKNKFIQTEWGIFAFKDFFANNINNVSTVEIKEFVKNLIENENQEKPLSDKEILEFVNKKFNINMQRRTIVKYRQEMNIPSFKERKFIYLIKNS